MATDTLLDIRPALPSPASSPAPTTCSAWVCVIRRVRAARLSIYVSAHTLFNLASLRGSLEAKIYRKELSAEMDPSDVAEAQRAAREWLSRV